MAFPIYRTKSVLIVLQLLCTLSFLSGKGQTTIATKLKIDTATISRLLDLAQKQTNPDSAQFYYGQMLTLCLEQGYPEGAAVSLMSAGLLLVEKGDFQGAIKHFKKAYSFCKVSSKKEHYLTSCYYNNTALAYASLGAYVQASQYYHKALQEISKTQKQGSMPALIYNNLATIQITLRQYRNALNYLCKGEELAKINKSNRELTMILGNKGLCYSELNVLDSAKKFYDETLSLAERWGYKDIECACYVNIGDFYISTFQPRKALPMLIKAIQVAHQAALPSASIVASYSLGRAYFQLGSYAEGQGVLEKALKDAETLQLKEEILEGYTTLASIYKATHQYAKACSIQDTLLVLKDSLMSTEKTKAINNLEIRYKTAEKDRQLAINSLQLAKQQRDIATKNLWIGGISAGVLILSLMLVGLYRADRHKQRLQSQQIRSLQQEQEIGILKAMMHGEENERGRIAREIHDGIGGILSATMMRFMSIRHKHAGLADTPEYEEVLTLLENMGGEIRKTAHNLMPEVLLKQGFPEAVRAFCNHIQSNGLQIDVQSYGNFEDLSHDFKLSVYRIIQELVQNILKHAKANHVLVQLMKHKEVFSITIEDDGVGFDSNAIRNGIGLHNLQTRVHNQNGRFTLESEEGKGTSVYIEFDVTENKENPVSEV